ncbi:PREDICTED: serum amyloid P-component-like [Thamnophis sirtalis]|uniref:C-reactive protein n=1 Tax=Thamnophis sirtalis TaxID=35019 RepID=A0A6I9Z1B5_9SAUR|nr:PREDICTED: serum amyloid P-component-like [Thamnophis sirtalis]
MTLRGLERTSQMQILCRGKVPGSNFRRILLFVLRSREISEECPRGSPFGEVTWFCTQYRPKRASQSSCGQLVPPSSTKMVLLLSFLLILACLSGSFGHEDLRNKVFAFPAPSATSAVVLPISNQQPLTKLTVCLSYYTLLTRPYGLFSYATRSVDNDFLIYKSQPNEYAIHVGGGVVNFKVAQKEKPSWEHICVSWDSSNGLVQFWLNGVPLPRQGLKKGYSINPEGSVLLGQDQDNFGGGFDINQSFVGEISDVNLWPRMLSPVEVGLSDKNFMLPSPLINWRSLSYTIKNEVGKGDGVTRRPRLGLYDSRKCEEGS